MNDVVMVSVPTYSSIDFTSDELPDWEVLEALPWVRNRVAKVARTRVGVSISTTGFVGRLVIPGFATIDVTELVPGTTDACVRLAATSPRSALQQSSATSNLRADEVAAVEFARECSEVLRRGAPRAYETTARSTDRPRGRMLAMPTIRRHWSRGQRGRIVERVRILSSDTPLSRVLLAGAVRAERLLRISQDLRGETALARMCIRILAGTMREPSAADFRRARVELDAVRAVELAEVLVYGMPVLPRSAQLTVPVSAWISLDRVFEDAIRAVIQRLVHPRIVTRGSQEGVGIWKLARGMAPSRPKRAEPDVCVRGPEGTWILDAKYRRSGEDVDDDSLYQLLAHSTAFGAVEAAIVTPAIREPPGVRVLGVDGVGCRCWVVSVDPSSADSLRGQLDTWVERVLEGSTGGSGDWVTTPA